MGNAFSLPRKTITPEELPDYIGKDAAKQILETPMRNREGEEITGKPAIHVLYTKDMKVGGEFMNRFYDSTLPAYAAKLGKKWGAKVGTADITGVGERDKHGRDAILRQDFGTDWGAATQEQRRRAIAIQNGARVQVHSIDITPAMRESVMQGQALFSVPPPSPPTSPTRRSSA